MYQHKPIWKATSKGKNYPAVKGTNTAKVAVVGGGITGVTTAYLLAQQGVDVLLLEGSHLGSGVTGHTTAHLTNMVDLYYHQIASKHNEEAAKRVSGATTSAISLIEELAQQEGIDCDFKRVPAWYYATNGKQQEKLQKEVEAMKKAGLNLHKEEDFPLPIHTQEVWRMNNQAHFNALKYLHGLAEAAEKLGAHIHEQSHVLEVQENDNGVYLRGEGFSVNADKVLLATHTPVGIDLLQTELEPYTSYALAATLEGPVPEGLFYDLHTPYHYIRDYTTDDGKSYAIVGGLDHKTGQADDMKAHMRALEEYTREHFPVKEVAYQWMAQVFVPADHLPFIGQRIRASRTYVATGFNGDGILWGTVSALMMKDLLQGRNHPWADTFEPARFTPSAAGQLAKENFNVAYRFVTDRFQQDAQTVDGVPRGSGRLVKVDGEQLAVHRDKDGKVHTFSPVCTHMGCIVQWNNEHGTWDCPCHGSRFKATGEVASGPAQEGLERKEV